MGDNDRPLNVAEAQEVVEQAAADGGNLSNEDTNAIVDRVTSTVIASLRPEQRTATSLSAALEGQEILTPGSGTVRGEYADLGTQFVNSEVYKRIQSAGTSHKFTEQVELAATLTSQPVIQPDVQVGLQLIRFRRLTIADLMAPGTTDSNLVRYLKETTATNAAAAVTEGSAKPESTLAADVADENVRKIATRIKITDEMLEDFEQTRSWVNGRLAMFVLLTEEQQLYDGNGTAPNLSGILDRSPQTQALGSETYFPRFIATENAKKKVRDYFYNPDGLVIAPGDWLQNRLEADANGQFGGGGPFRGPYGNGTGPQEEGPYAGLRVVVTPAATEGTALVGAFAEAAQIFRRSGVTVEMTNSNEDDFNLNLVSVRAEERLALAVYNANAFCTITGLGA